MGTIYRTDPKYIKYLDCNPSVDRRIFFQTCNLGIKEGAKILQTSSLCDFTLESLGNSEMGGCGGTLKRGAKISPSSNYVLTATEIGQEQGEVQMIVVKVKYEKSHPVEERYMNWEYKGNVYPINTLMVLTGRTKPDTPWQGWDLSNYTNNPIPMDISPNIYPQIGSPDLSFGGIMFTNPSDKYTTELEIFIFN
jgi:hypothetical protein